MSVTQKRFFALVLWLMLAIVLNGLKLPADSMLWWVLVAPPAALMVVWLAGGFVTALIALALALRAPGRR